MSVFDGQIFNGGIGDGLSRGNWNLAVVIRPFWSSIRILWGGSRLLMFLLIPLDSCETEEKVFLFFFFFCHRWWWLPNVTVSLLTGRKLNRPLVLNHNLCLWELTLNIFTDMGLAIVDWKRLLRTTNLIPMSNMTFMFISNIIHLEILHGLRRTFWHQLTDSE